METEARDINISSQSGMPAPTFTAFKIRNNTSEGESKFLN
jgi:hypothetical protein